MDTRDTFKRKKTNLEESGQAIVEFALVLPIFIMILFAIVEFSWIGYQKASFEYGYIQASWYVSANDLNDYDDLEKIPSEAIYKGSIVSDTLREDMEDSSLGVNPTKLSIRDAEAKLYNEKGTFKVIGQDGSEVDAYGITRYMDLTANIDYEIQPLTFFGKSLFGDNLSFTKDLDRTRVVRRQVRTE